MQTSLPHGHALLFRSRSDRYRTLDLLSQYSYKFLFFELDTGHYAMIDISVIDFELQPHNHGLRTSSVQVSGPWQAHKPWLISTVPHSSDGQC